MMNEGWWITRSQNTGISFHKETFLDEERGQNFDFNLMTILKRLFRFSCCLWHQLCGLYK